MRWPWVAVPGALFGAGVGAGMIVRDCALTCNVGFRLVPLAWVAIALLAVPVVALQVGLLRRVSFATWQVACPLLVAACLVGFRAWTGWAVDAHPYSSAAEPARAVQAAYLTYYVWIDPALVLLATNLVCLAARVHADDVPRGLAVLPPAILAGGMAGSALAKALVPALVEAGVKYEHARDGLLLVMAAALVGVAAASRAAAGRFPGAAPPATAPAAGLLADARAVLAERGVALTGLVLVLTGAASVLIDYLFFWSVTEEVDGRAGRTGWFATFYLVLNAVTLGLLLFGTPRLLARLGLLTALLTLPIALLAGGGWALLAPSLLAVCALRVSRDALVKSLFEPATERLMLRAGGARYEAVRTVLGGLGFSLGMGLGGALAAGLASGAGAPRAAVVGALLVVLLAWMAAIAAAVRTCAEDPVGARSAPAGPPVTS